MRISHALSFVVITALACFALPSAWHPPYSKTSTTLKEYNRTPNTRSAPAPTEANVWSKRPTAVTAPGTRGIAAPLVARISLEQDIRTLETWSHSELQSALTEVRERLQVESWIERANAGELSSQELELLQQIMHQEDVLKLALLRRQLATLERDHF